MRADITVSPVDSDGRGDGITNFGRRYPSGTVVTLTAPGSLGGRNFLKWTKNGTDHDTSATTTVTMDETGQRLVAVYDTSGYRVCAWGLNLSGQIGDGTATQRTKPVLVSGLGEALAIGTGEYHSLAAMGDGTTQAWGNNSVGQLGDDTTASRNLPVTVNGLTNVVELAGNSATGGAGVTESHTVALRSDGTVWTWGYNAYGQLGDGTTTNRGIPGQVPGLTNVVAICAGHQHTLALKADGTVWAWGRNGAERRLGDGTSTDRSSPVQVVGLNGAGYLTGVVAISTGLYHSAALKGDGTVWTWGQNNYGALGRGSAMVYTPDQVHGPGDVGYLTEIVGVCSGRYGSAAIRADGTLWAWGYNGAGRLGDGTTTDRNVPVQVLGAGGSGFLTDVVGVDTTAHTVAWKADGTAWAWGNNLRGGLGDGTTTNRYTPVQVKGLGGRAALENVAALSAGGQHTLALAIPPPERTLTVQSETVWGDPNPVVVATITVSPVDNYNNGNGQTEFTRTYFEGALVSLTAPAAFEDFIFLKWTKDGSDYSTARTISVSMTEDCTLVAVYYTFVRTINVRSGPGEGAMITVNPVDRRGNSSGPTEFERKYDDAVEVSLTAPATHNGQPFLKWIRNWSDYSTDMATTVVMDEDCGMMVLYGYELSVTSSPSPGVAVIINTADNAGSFGERATNFTLCYSGGTEVSLTAAATFGRRNFLKWTSNGADHGTSAATTVVVNATTAMTAVYGPELYTITVQSSPDSGAAVQVSADDSQGRGNGNTAFTRTYVKDTLVTLTAPAEHNGKVFVKWTKDGVDQGASNSITVTANADYTLVAVYVTPVYTLTVQSLPTSGASVTVTPADNAGQGNGTTEFSRNYDGGAVVWLAAPASHGGLSFVRWTRNGVAHDTQSNTSITMTANCTLAAVYGTSEIGPEAHQDGPAGSVVQVPIRLMLVGGKKLTTLGFRVSVTPSTGSPPAVSSVTFVPDAALPTPGFNDNTTVPGSVLLGWFTDISPALSGTVTLGEVRVPVPAAAQAGSEYTVSVLNPSGTNVGVPVTIVPGPNGSISVSGVWYLVGDVEGYGGGDAGGQFGNGTLDNADVRAAFYWSFGVAAPPGAVAVPTAGSDRFDAADAAGEDVPPTAGGSSGIDNADVRLTFLRSLLPLERYERCRSGTGRISRRVTVEPLRAVLRQALADTGNTVGPEADQTVPTGTVAEVPIILGLASGVQLTSLQFRLTVAPANGSPPAISAVTFVRDASLPQPTLNDNTTLPGSALVGWLTDISPALSGTRTLGILRIPIPATAESGDTYLISLRSPSGTNVGLSVTLEAGANKTLSVGTLRQLTFLPSPGGEITGDLEGDYPEGATVNLHATAQSDYRFSKWRVNGLDAGTSLDLELTMDEDKSVEAVFAFQMTLTVVGGTGSGKYDEGTVVPIVAQIPPGQVFLCWTGDVATVADVNDAETDITMNSVCTVTATFEAVPALAIMADLDHDWVYQNTPVATQDRHHSVLTVEITGGNLEGQTYAITIGQGHGPLVSFQVAQPVAIVPGMPQTLNVLGGRRATTAPSPAPAGVYQAYVLDVTVTGTPILQTATAEVSLVLRALGDIDGDGLVNAADKLEMNKKLNGLANLPGITLRDLDLSGDGALVNAEDKLTINQVLNGLTVP